MKSVRSLARKLRSFSRLPAFIQLGMVPTWCLLGLARILVLTIPFRTIAARLGKHAGVQISIPIISKQAVMRAHLISRLVRTTARYCPWNANCFAQAITARTWLACYGIPYALYFGVKKSPEQQLEAHAWVCAGPVKVTGGDSFDTFTVVSVFVSKDNG